MYRLSQWAGDFPMLWEPHGSFTPLFTSQPEELAFSKSVSLRLHISASCPVFLFSLLFFLFFFFFFLLSRFSSELQRRQCRLVAPPFSAGPLAALLRRTHRQDLSLCWWIELSYTMIDRVRIQTDILRSRSGCWWKESSWQYSQVPTASYPLRDPVSPFPFESHLYWLTMSLIFFFPLFFFGQRFLTVHWQILYKIAI